MTTQAFARELVAKFGTPLYAYDLEEVERRAKELASVLPDGSRLFYSVKANPHPDIAACLARLGLGAEISSSGELDAVARAAVKGRDLIYTGPGKEPCEIARALTAGVRCFSCESLTDLRRINEAARAAKVTPRVLLRVNPSGRPKAQIAMSGVRSQFGFEEGELPSWSNRAGQFDQVEIAGVHVYFGTQMESCSALLSAFEEAIAAAERVGAGLRIAPRIIDIGGGFPWPYASDGVGPDLSELRLGLSCLAERARKIGCDELWFESGRYLVASSGCLLSSVMDVKRSKDGSRLLVLDAGINHLAGMAGLRRLMPPSITAEVVGAEANRDRDIVDLFGPLCTPLDCIGRNVDIPIPRCGEFIQIPNVGAYGLTASLLGFLGRPCPVEVIHRAEQLLSASRLEIRQSTIEVHPSDGASALDVQQRFERYGKGQGRV